VVDSSTPPAMNYNHRGAQHGHRTAGKFSRRDGRWTPRICWSIGEWNHPMRL